jgi:hypothetical protein
MSNPELLNDEMLDEYDFSKATRRNPYLLNGDRTITIETCTGEQQIKIETVEVTAIVNPDGTVSFQMPPKIQPGEYKFTVLVQVPR